MIGLRDQKPECIRAYVYRCYSHFAVSREGDFIPPSPIRVDTIMIYQIYKGMKGQTQANLKNLCRKGKPLHVPPHAFGDNV